MRRNSRRNSLSRLRASQELDRVSEVLTASEVPLVLGEELRLFAVTRSPAAAAAASAARCVVLA